MNTRTEDHSFADVSHCHHHTDDSDCRQASARRPAVSTMRTRRPAASAQKAAPMPRNVSPDAATANVITADSRPSAADNAPDKLAASVPSSASPATAPMTSAGAALASVVNAAESSPRTRYDHPAVDDAIHRLAGSGSASGAADRDAVMAARLTAWPPAVAVTAVASPVAAIVSRHGTW